MITKKEMNAPELLNNYIDILKLSNKNIFFTVFLNEWPLQ